MKIQETKTGRKYIKVKGKRLYLNTFLKRVNKKRLICHLLPISKITEKNAEKLILFLLDPTKKKLPKVKTKKDKVKLKEVKSLRSKIEKGIEQIKKIREVEQETKKQIKTEKDKDIIDKLKKSLKETQEAERAQAKVIKEVGQDVDKAIKELNKDLPKEQKLPTYRETYPEVFTPFPTEAEIEEATRDQPEQPLDRKQQAPMTEMLFEGLGKQNGGAGDKEKLRKLWNYRNGYPNLSDSDIWQQNDYPYLENFDKGIKEIRTSNFINNLNTRNREHKETINSLDEKIKSGKRYVSILEQYIDEKPDKIEKYKERINKLTNEIKRNTRIKSLFETSDKDKKEMDELLNIPSKGSKNVKSIIKKYITNDTFKSLYDELKEIDDLEKKANDTPLFDELTENDDLTDDENQEGGFRPIDFYQRQINMATRQIQNLQPLRHGNAIKALKKFLRGRYQDHNIEPSERELLLSEMSENWPRNRTINIEIPTNINSSRRLDFSNDKDEKEQKGGLIDQPEEALSNVEIENIMKKYKNFLGVSPVDTGYKLLHMVKPKSNGGLIYNLDKAGERGSHWVAVYYDARPGRKNNICYYDSFGRDIPKEIQGDIKQIVKLLDCDKHMKLKINRKVNQDKSSVSCGYLCCLFLMDLFRNKSFKSATGFSVKKNEDRAEDLQEKFDYIL